MVIKSEERESVLIAVLIIFLLIGIVTLVLGNKNYDYLYWVLGILSIGSIWDFVITGRTLIMDKNGCTIKFYKYQRTYAWDELKIKRKEYGYWFSSYKHSNGVFFSVHSVKKPKWMDSYIYCMFRHPFTCFFVHPTDADELNKFMNTIHFKGEAGIYLVDKEVFFPKMEEWGVELTED